MPGQDWYKSFMEKNKQDVKGIIGQNIWCKRAEVDHAVLDEYFDNLLTEIDGLPASRIINSSPLTRPICRMTLENKSLYSREAASIQKCLILPKQPLALWFWALHLVGCSPLTSLHLVGCSPLMSSIKV